jgi:hypothetical protein
VDFIQATAEKTLSKNAEQGKRAIPCVKDEVMIHLINSHKFHAREIGIATRSRIARDIIKTFQTPRALLETPTDVVAARQALLFCFRTCFTYIALPRLAIHAKPEQS